MERKDSIEGYSCDSEVFRGVSALFEEKISTGEALVEVSINGINQDDYESSIFGTVEFAVATDDDPDVESISFRLQMGGYSPHSLYREGDEFPSHRQELRATVYPRYQQLRWLEANSRSTDETVLIPTEGDAMCYRTSGNSFTFMNEFQDQAKLFVSAVDRLTRRPGTEIDPTINIFITFRELLDGQQDLSDREAKDPALLIGGFAVGSNDTKGQRKL